MPYKRQSVKALGRAVSYILQKHKTVDADGRQWATGINCSPQFAFQEFRATRAAYHKDSPVWFYHYTQSFAPDEPITVQQAHELAKEFAEKAWPDSQILVATHIDREHIHSHFVVNSVCYESGYMLRQGPTTLAKLRKLSDEICLAHGFSVLPPDPPRHSKQLGTREYRSMEKNQSWKMQLMIAIEDAMAVARSREHFIKLLERKGYEAKWTDERKSITYTTPVGMKCRDIKLYDAKFLKEMMEYEFKLRAEIIGRIGGAVPQAGENGGRGSALRDGDREELGGTARATAVTNSVAGGGSDSGGAAGDQGGTGGVPRPASAGVGELHPRNAIVGAEVPAGDRTVCLGDCEEPNVTGWENERRIFEESLFAGGADEKILSGTVLDRTDSIGGAGDFGIDLAYLSADISGMIDDRRPQDSTTMRKQKHKKRALGQKSDERDFEQKM
ncbi:relaxase/mobilization nuclease domain-containing protein [Acutalibacter caecimuris]|uniref:relaxase/mobilization nuclease domain-containing protein n=1 Tax=Acutalibacter caecimuris TaxID=3093657 RepID=UPI002AC9DA38|nr:relaxase/mobilization nuclease domain-containing protein [Acutalibacter sp. M00118]